MTIREFYNAVVGADVAEDIKQFASDKLAEMDAKNAKRRNTPSKTQIANEETKQEIFALLEGGAKVASEIAESLSLTTQKVSALCRAMVADGRLDVVEVKVKGAGKVKQYSIKE